MFHCEGVTVNLFLNSEMANWHDASSSRYTITIKANVETTRYECSDITGLSLISFSYFSYTVKSCFCFTVLCTVFRLHDVCLRERENCTPMPRTWRSDATFQGLIDHGLLKLWVVLFTGRNLRQKSLYYVLCNVVATFVDFFTSFFIALIP